MYFTRPKIQNTEKGDNRKGDGKNIGFLQRHMFQENPSRTIFLEKRDRNAATSSTRQEEKKVLLSNYTFIVLHGMAMAYTVTKQPPPLSLVIQENKGSK